MRNDKWSRNVIHLTCVLTVAVGLISVAASAQAPERSRTEGLKETDRFIKAGASTSEAVAAAKAEVQKTLTAYNTLVTQPSKNMKGDYKKLMKSMDSMNRRVTAATAKIGEMQAASDTYFQGRKRTIAGIQDASLHGQAQERMQQSQKDFDGVLSALNDAGHSLEPFRKQLDDHITFLGSDLNPSATSSLRPEAEKLNTEGAKIFNQTDQAIAKSNGYFNGLKGQS